MARRVTPGQQRVTVLTDRNLADGSTVDKYFQYVSIPDITLGEWRRKLREGEIQFRCDTVWLMVGNTEVPLDPTMTAVSQMRKLVLCLVTNCHRKLKKICVTSVLPRPDREVMLEEHIKDINLGYVDAVKDLKRNFSIARMVEWVPTHKLFLENFRFMDVGTGKKTTHVRIIKPVDRYFIPGTKDLNVVGLYHLKSYMLQHLKILEEVNVWSGMRTVDEPEEIQREKRTAWQRANHFDSVLPWMGQEDDGDTDVEDEGTVPHQLHMKCRYVVSETSVTSSEQDRRRVVRRGSGELGVMPDTASDSRATGASSSQ